MTLWSHTYTFVRQHHHIVFPLYLIIIMSIPPYLIIIMIVSIFVTISTNSHSPADPPWLHPSERLSIIINCRHCQRPPQEFRNYNLVKKNDENVADKKMVITKSSLIAATASARPKNSEIIIW